MAEAVRQLIGRGRGVLCARERWAKGVTLGNFALNSSVISSKAIYLTFSCGICRVEGSRFFLYHLFFPPFLLLQSDLSGLSAKVNTPQSLINSVNVVEGCTFVLRATWVCVYTYVCACMLNQQLWPHETKCCHRKLVIKIPATKQAAGCTFRGPLRYVPIISHHIETVWFVDYPQPISNL